MQTTIPAHTEISCDRCKMVIVDSDHHTQLAVNPNYNHEEADQTFDLCPLCMGKFYSFMRREEIKP